MSQTIESHVFTALNGLSRSCWIVVPSILVLSCAGPQSSPAHLETGSDGVEQASVTSTAEVGAPGFTSGNDSTSASVDEINAFLMEARSDLMAHRSGTDEAETASDNDSAFEPQSGSLEVVALSSTAEGGEAATEGGSVQEVVEATPGTPPTAIDIIAQGALVESLELETYPAPTPTTTETAAAVADTAAPAAPADTGDVVAAWIKSLMDHAAGSDTPLRHHLTLAIVLGMTAPDRPFHPEGLSELTDEEQDLVRIVYEQFQQLAEDLDAGGDSASVVKVLSSLVQLVEAEEPFRIARMDLCSWVRDYGDVDVIEPPTFAPKERPRFIWYVELAGVQPTEDTTTGAWLYEFDLRLELLTRDTGIPVIAPIEGTVRHSATSEVRDLFLRDLFEMPSELQFDWYTTKLTITDRQSGAQAQKSFDLLWVPNLAAGAAHIERRVTASPVE